MVPELLIRVLFQLKEKKRIQEAGGFVAMNGVWRVQVQQSTIT
jgi:hypothetical protein